MIQKINIPLRPFSKPRGKLGRKGNIYHNDENYRLWKKQFLSCLETVQFKLPDFFYCLGFCFYIKPKRGHKPDCDNMVGSILDALKEGGYIIDDDYENIPKGIWVAKKSEIDKISLFVMGSQKDFVYFAANEQKLIQ